MVTAWGVHGVRRPGRCKEQIDDLSYRLFFMVNRSLYIAYFLLIAELLYFCDTRYEATISLGKAGYRLCCFCQ